MKNGKHRFAFFASLGNVSSGKKQIESIQNPALVKRIALVLRMQEGDSVQLFDRDHVAEVVLQSVSKKEVQYEVISCEKIVSIDPEIICLLPLLKRDALEDAVTRLAILGVSQIQLVITEKSRRSITAKEFDRLEKMIIAAAEQSKQFSTPVIKPAQSLANLLPVNAYHLFLFDQYGSTAREIIAKSCTDSIAVAFGPEGDFTDEEKKLLKKHNFVSLCLTKSVLRTIDAVLLGVGLLRLS